VEFLWRFLEHVQLEGDPGAEDELAGGIIYIPSGQGTSQDLPRKSWRVSLDLPLEPVAPCNLSEVVISVR